MDDKFRATQRNTFSLHLERSGKRLTPERVFILDTALGMKSHFTANDLRQAMEGGNMRVSRATLFNTLPLMTECGVLRRFSGARGVAYEVLRSSVEPRQNLVCAVCGKSFSKSSSLANHRTGARRRL